MNYDKKKYGITCESCEILSVTLLSKRTHRIVCFCNPYEASSNASVLVVYEADFPRSKFAAAGALITHINTNVLEEEVLM